jgi:parallel beta helix pectate lyase-like protein/uncharacterized protein DUF1565
VRLALVAVVLAGALTATSGGTTMLPARKGSFFVSPTGSDGNPGTAKRPWRTVTKALNMLKPGQRALVRPGDYGRVRCQHGKGGSAAGGYVTVRAYPARRAVVKAAADGVVWINCDYVRVQGFVIAGPAVVGGTNIYGVEGSDHVQIVGNEIRESICQGIALEEETDAWSITRNWIHDNGDGCDEQAHGIYLQGNGHLVANNVIDRQPEGYGIQVYDYDRNPRIVNNTIAHSGRGGIVVGGTGCRSGGGCGVAGALVVNNVLAYNSGHGIARDDAPKSCNIHSNLAFANDSSSYSSGWPDGCLGSNRAGNPLFVDPSRPNYHLRARSPAIGAGDPRVTVSPDYDGVSRPRGRRPDLGAYQFRSRIRRH